MLRTMDKKAITALTERLRAQAGDRGHRAVLLLCGEAESVRRQALDWLDASACKDMLWVGVPLFEGHETLTWGKARNWLGRELSVLVIDAFAGFDADGFAALSGTLRAGGLLLCLNPPLDEWAAYADPEHARFASWPYPASAVSGHFLQRLVQCIRTQPGVISWLPEQTAPRIPPPCGGQGLPPVAPPPYAHLEQQAAVAAIHHVVQGHRRRPLVLSADRGRGKSAALGIAAAQLLQQGTGPILITAPSLAAAGQVFAHAARLLPGAELRPGGLNWQGHGLQFVAPDSLLQEQPRAALLMVDEAAAIPLGMLEAILRQYARLVLATTVHGYEGSGRGFLLRFTRRLDTLTPGWQSLRINQAVRWAEGDPLEALVEQALLLDAEAVDAVELAGLDPAACECEWLARDRLASNETDLRQLFGLLQLAHYRTSPNDLRQMLDAPDIHVAVLRWQGRIVATVLLADEGGLDEALAAAVHAGERRLRGHLLAQSMAVHAGFAEAATLHGVRVVRLAVHPDCQRRGLGRQLLQAVRKRFAERDYLGASFGASDALLAFWQAEGLFPLRLGLKREASSGAHAVMVLQPLSVPGDERYRAMRDRFCQQLPILLREPLQDLEEALVTALLARCPSNTQLTAQDWRDIRSFAWGQRGYEVCMVALQGLVLARADGLHRLETRPRQLLVYKVVQQQAWPRCAAQAGLAGRAEALQALREAVRSLVQCDADHGVVADMSAE